MKFLGEIVSRGEGELRVGESRGEGGATGWGVNSGEPFGIGIKSLEPDACKLGEDLDERLREEVALIDAGALPVDGEDEFVVGGSFDDVCILKLLLLNVRGLRLRMLGEEATGEGIDRGVPFWEGSFMEL